jgi:hypothetical protein
MPLPTIPSGNVSSGLATGYNVANSLRFNDGDSARLTRSFSSGNSALWTWSGWIKRSTLGSRQIIFSAYNNSTTYTTMEFTANDEIKFNDENNNNTNGRIQSTAKFRDPAAWMHVVFHWDSSDSTSGDRLRMYVNNERITDFSDTGNAPSTGSQVNTNITHEIGSMNNSNFFDGYMAEVCFIDGSNLDPDQFGEYDEDSPTIWKPKDVSGLTFGTTGFYLDFEDSGDLDDDESGNTNDWTAVNLAAIDQTTDTCTNNFCTINPLDYHPTVPADAEGNTVYNKSNTGDTHNSFATCTIGVTAGKWYYELKLGDSNAFMVGWVKTPHSAPDSAGAYASDSGLYTVKDNGSKIVAGSETGSAWNTVTTNDIIGLAYDFDNLKFYISKNGTWQNSGDPTSGATGTGSFGNIASGATYVPMIGNANYGATSLHYFNFGNPAFTISSGNSDGNGYGNFEYAVPSGYLALCTKNLGSDGG